ncbi:hypothetical protein D3C83_174530 [compost metagenome]
MSRMSRLKLGAASRTSPAKLVPGPTASWVTRTRLAVTVITPPPVDSEKARLVLPCRLVVMSEIV